MMRRPNFGFTLVEVLVVATLLLALLALLLPALETARGSARRAACGSNLRQLGVAVESYVSTNGCYPIGQHRTGDLRFGSADPCVELAPPGYSALVALLPFIEESARYDGWNSKLAILAIENYTFGGNVPKIFSCPADALAGTGVSAPSLTALEGRVDAPRPPGGEWSVGFASYAFCFGRAPAVGQPGFLIPNCAAAPEGIRQNDGCFNMLSPLGPKDVIDGLSKTMLAAEHSAYLTRFVGAGDHSWSHCAWWHLGAWGSTLFTATSPPVSGSNSAGVPGSWLTLGASSMHPGGIQALMGDGSVQFVSEAVSSWPLNFDQRTPQGSKWNNAGYMENLPPSAVWQAMATRAGQEAAVE